jgi:hypothetical protein
MLAVPPAGLGWAAAANKSTVHLYAFDLLIQRPVLFDG